MTIFWWLRPAVSKDGSHALTWEGRGWKWESKPSYSFVFFIAVIEQVSRPPMSSSEYFWYLTLTRTLPDHLTIIWPSPDLTFFRRFYTSPDIHLIFTWQSPDVHLMFTLRSPDHHLTFLWHLWVFVMKNDLRDDPDIGVGPTTYNPTTI